MGLKIVGFVHILKHVCLDASKRNRCSVVCVCEGENSCVHLCVFATVWDESFGHIYIYHNKCNLVFMCVCLFDLTEGVLY